MDFVMALLRGEEAQLVKRRARAVEQLEEARAKRDEAIAVRDESEARLEELRRVMAVLQAEAAEVPAP